MAIGVHVVNVGVVSIDSTTGERINKDTASLRDMMNVNTEHRILPSGSVANAANFPTVADYIALEASIDFVVRYIDQNLIITYDQGDANSAS